MLSREEIIRKIADEREREWIRDAILLKNKKAGETLKICFDLMNFSKKLNKLGKK